MIKGMKPKAALKLKIPKLPKKQNQLIKIKSLYACAVEPWKDDWKLELEISTNPSRNSNILISSINDRSLLNKIFTFTFSYYFFKNIKFFPILF